MTPIGLTAVVRLVVVHAKTRQPITVSSLAVHGLVLAARDSAYRAKVEQFDVLAADGHPVRWLMNRVSAPDLSARVSGTDLMERACGACAESGVGVYLYGSTERVNRSLARKLQERYPLLNVGGAEPSVFRPLTAREESELVARINSSGAGVLFVGLGCPLQEEFAHALKDRICLVQVCVGAAFDFLAGEKVRAPQWMQNRGLEWLHRLAAEPRRLWKRYLTTNITFLWLVFLSSSRRGR